MQTKLGGRKKLLFSVLELVTSLYFKWHLRQHFHPDTFCPHPCCLSCFVAHTHRRVKHIFALSTDEWRWNIFYNYHKKLLFAQGDCRRTLSFIAIFRRQNKNNKNQKEEEGKDGKTSSLAATTQFRFRQGTKCWIKVRDNKLTGGRNQLTGGREKGIASFFKIVLFAVPFTSAKCYQWLFGDWLREEKSNKKRWKAMVTSTERLRRTGLWQLNWLSRSQRRSDHLVVVVVVRGDTVVRQSPAPTDFLHLPSNHSSIDSTHCNSISGQPPHMDDRTWQEKRQKSSALSACCCCLLRLMTEMASMRS